MKNKKTASVMRQQEIAMPRVLIRIVNTT